MALLYGNIGVNQEMFLIGSSSIQMYSAAILNQVRKSVLHKCNNCRANLKGNSKSNA